MDGQASIDLIRQVNRLQQQLDGLIKPEVSRWSAWTPTFTQSVAVTATINYARYTVIGWTVHLVGNITFTSGGTAGNNIIMGGLPVNNANVFGADVYNVAGHFFYLDSGTASYNGHVYGRANNNVAFIDWSTNSFLGISPNFAIANNDRLGFNITYEKA